MVDAGHAVYAGQTLLKMQVRVLPSRQTYTQRSEVNRLIQCNNADREAMLPVTVERHTKVYLLLYCINSRSLLTARKDGHLLSSLNKQADFKVG